MMEIIKKPELAVYSPNPVYFPITTNSGNQPECKYNVPGIGPVIDLQPCSHPFVFHGLTSYPAGDFIFSRVVQGINPATRGHEGHVFSYTVPKNNITASNNCESSQRQEMKEEVGEGFYNLVMTTKFGQRVIRLGSALQDGYLAILKGAGFQRIFRYGNEGGANWFYVYQAVKEKQAEIHDVVRIEGSTAHRIYGFYHFSVFEYVQGLAGLVPIEVYLQQCSSKMRARLTDVANRVADDTPLPLPLSVAQCVRLNNSALKQFS